MSPRLGRPEMAEKFDREPERPVTSVDGPSKRTCCSADKAFSRRSLSQVPRTAGQPAFCPASLSRVLTTSAAQEGRGDVQRAGRAGRGRVRQFPRQGRPAEAGRAVWQPGKNVGTHFADGKV